MHGDGGGPEHPMARAVMLERADDADRYHRDFELLRNAECAILKFAHAAVAGSLAFWKNNEAGAVVDGVAGKAPHALEIGGAANVRHGNIPETFHQPAINGNFEVRFQLPAANKLRYGAVQRKGIEKIDVI